MCRRALSRSSGALLSRTLAVPRTSVRPLRTPARRDRHSAAVMDSFLEHTGPDLVIEVEITNADEGKIERYDAMGVRKAVAAARTQGLAGASGRLPLPAPRGAAATPRSFGGPGWPHARRCVRRSGAGPAGSDRDRETGSGSQDRPPAPAGQRAGSRATRATVPGPSTPVKVSPSNLAQERPAGSFRAETPHVRTSGRYMRLPAFLPKGRTSKIRSH